MKEETEEVFKIIQTLLKDPPVIIWGSGATVPYGIPSTDDLNAILLEHGVEGLDTNSNLEDNLNKLPENELDRVGDIIVKEVLDKDLLFLNKVVKDRQIISPIISMLDYLLLKPKYEMTGIITLNYDRVLEYALAQSKIPYTDGFLGKILSKFDEDLFQINRLNISLIKVHGSLNWNYCNNEMIFFPEEYKNKEMLKSFLSSVILPTREKYKNAFQNPYRSLISLSDDRIKKAKSFFVLGFGFNDDHITPEVENKIKGGTPIVVITKEATPSCQKKMENIRNYCLLQKDNDKTKVMYSKNDAKKTILLDGEYWKLNKFMEMLI